MKFIFDNTGVEGYLENLGEWMANHFTTYDEDEVYKAGLNDAWEAARKIAGIYDVDEMLDCFGDNSFRAVFLNNSPTEAIAKIREHEEKKKALEPVIGDELKSLIKNRKAVVVGTKHDGWQVLLMKDSEPVGISEILINNLVNWHKTGRHFPQVAEKVAEILEALKEEKEAEHEKG